MIKREQMVFLGNPEYGCELQPIDFAAFAQTCGGIGMTIEDPERCGPVKALSPRHRTEVIPASPLSSGEWNNWSRRSARRSVRLNRSAGPNSRNLQTLCCVTKCRRSSTRHRNPNRCSAAILASLVRGFALGRFGRRLSSHSSGDGICHRFHWRGSRGVGRIHKLV